jgi:glycosyltransferase involved in cell wall biosynthesis
VPGLPAGAEVSFLMLVSIILPSRNEEAFIAKALDSILAQVKGRDDIEVLCVDGMSTDRTRQIVSDYAARDPRVRLIDNPGRTPPRALNAGIANARGRIIVRMDCHSECSPNYVEANVELIQRTGAECVGGYVTTLPGKDTPVGRSIAAALSGRFGVGNCRSRTVKDSNEEEESDEATFGTWPRELFDRIGLFDERLDRNQDMEFFTRIRKHGGRIIISPKITVTYYARSTFASFCKQAFDNGKWGPYTLYLVGGGMRPRHFAPMAFVAALLAGALGGWVWWPLWILPPAALLTYLTVGCIFSVKGAREYRTWWPLVLAAFMQLHLAYGTGSLWGALSAPFRFGLSPRRGRREPGASQKA